MGCGCGCGGKCGSGLGAYGPVAPLAQHGFRLSIPGGPPGGQIHGVVTANPTDLHYHGAVARNLTGNNSPLVNPVHHSPHIDPFHRAPGELPPRPNASGDLNINSVPHMPHVPGFAMVPGGLFPVSRLGAVPAVRNPIIRTPGNGTSMWVPMSPTNIAQVYPPGYSGSTAPAPVVAGGCPPGQYQDAAGNCTSDWRNPYPVTLPIQPSPVVMADTSGTPTAGQSGCVSGQYDTYGNCVASTIPGTTTSNWLTDPTQELITGIPNWGLVAGAAAGLFLLMGKRR